MKIGERIVELWRTQKFPMFYSRGCPPRVFSIYPQVSYYSWIPRIKRRKKFHYGIHPPTPLRGTTHKKYSNFSTNVFFEKKNEFWILAMSFGFIRPAKCMLQHLTLSKFDLFCPPNRKYNGIPSICRYIKYLPKISKYNDYVRSIFLNCTHIGIPHFNMHCICYTPTVFSWVMTWHCSLYSYEFMIMIFTIQ